ncbi:hypothetical protein LLG10_08650, partial [bacterium]|nr:hypothetical protein [bacterium]
GLGLIPPINHQNDQCYLMYTNGTTSWVFITLPNGYKAKIEFFFGPEAIFLSKPPRVKITIEGLDGPIDELTSNFIRGIYAGLDALFEGNSLININDLFAAIDNASSLTDYFDEFCKITGRDPKGSYWGEASVATTFMKHAIIGGYIATKMQNFGVENEDNINNMIGFWVSFFAERARIYYKNVHGYARNIPFQSSSDELGLIDIANFCKILAVAENGDGSVEDNVFTTHNNNQMNVTYAPNKNNYWLFDGSNGLTEIDFTKASYIGYDNSAKFVNIGAGIGILFSFVKDSTPDGIGFHTKLRLYDWLCAGRSYNGDLKDRTGKKNITYNHAKKLMILINTLYKGKFGQDDMNAFNKQLEELANHPEKRSLDVFYPNGKRPSIP